MKDFIESNVRSIVEGKGLDLVELHISDRGSHFQVRALVDYPTGGIDMDMCTKVNREIVGFLEGKQAVLGKDFSVEVSSPGIDRKLKSKRDFMRVLGKKAIIGVKEPILDKMELKGSLLSVNDDAVKLQIKDKDYTHSVLVPYDVIVWGKVVF